MIEVHNPNKLPVADYRDLVELQPESFKDLSDINFEKMRASMEQHGFIYPFFVWVNKGTKYILDGHQRKRVLSVVAPEGLEVPYIVIEAKNKKDAAEKLLAADSRYGKRTAGGELDFVTQFDIDDFYINDVAVMEFKAPDFDEGETKDKEDNVYSGRFPLAVILTTKDYNDWVNYKKSYMLKNDTQAFLKLMSDNLVKL